MNNDHSKIERKYYKVTYELTEFQVECLLGALEMGFFMEDWLAGLASAATNSYDSSRDKMFANINYFQDEIVKQTGITTKNLQCSMDSWEVKAIRDFVKRQIKKLKKNYWAWENDYLEKEGYKQ